MPTSMLAAALQLHNGPDRDANRDRCFALLDRAHAAGATFLATPENTDQIAPKEIRLAAAEPLSGPFINSYRQKSRELGAWVLVGSFAEALGGDKVHNTSVLIDPAGEVAAVYRKIHLFDATTADGVRYHESDAVQPGADLVTAELPCGTLGLTVCYDLRFPELFRALSARGASVLTVPSAFTVPTGRAHWETLLRARAIENLAYVVAPAQVGEHFPGRRSYGHALVVDPWGEVLSDAGDAGEGFALGVIDPARIQAVRAMIPALSHRRLSH